MAEVTLTLAFLALSLALVIYGRIMYYVLFPFIPRELLLGVLCVLFAWVESLLIQ